MQNLEAKIAAHPFCKDLDPKHLALLYEGVSQVEFAPGQIIAREGEEAGHFYFLLRGKVLIEAMIPAQGQVGVQTVQGGDVLGWSWLLPPFRWHFTARASEATEAFAWETAHLRAQAEKHPKFGYEMASRMTQVLLQRLHATHPRLVDFYPPPT